MRILTLEEVGAVSGAHSGHTKFSYSSSFKFKTSSSSKSGTGTGSKSKSSTSMSCKVKVKGSDAGSLPAVDFCGCICAPTPV